MKSAHKNIYCALLIFGGEQWCSRLTRVLLKHIGHIAPVLREGVYRRKRWRRCEGNRPSVVVREFYRETVT